MIPDGTGGLAVIALAAGAAVYDRVRAWRRVEPGTVASVKRQYRRGGIDERELERRLDVVADPEAARIREAVERINGIGESTSWDIASEFDTLDAVREASLNRLQEVPDVGEHRAQAIQERL